MDSRMQIRAQTFAFQSTSSKPGFSPAQHYFCWDYIIPCCRAPPCASQIAGPRHLPQPTDAGNPCIRL